VVEEQPSNVVSKTPVTGQGLYILMISVHGLIRTHDMELGRDADTGGQIKYVVELGRALTRHDDVARLDLLTRQVFDPKISEDYAQPLEPLAESKGYLVRLPCGPRRYLRKEVLWPYLDSFADRALQHIRQVGRVPDIIHSHYADAGYVGARLASLLGVPLIFTGHSLGRVKNQRLIAHGTRPEVIEGQYHISRRIEAEEVALDTAAAVIASTSQEVEDQYSLYDNYQPGRMTVIPPGIELDRFYPPRRAWSKPPIYAEMARFLRNPNQPMILALSRPDARKNIGTLLHAFGRNEYLRKIANLVIVAGNRDDIQALEKGPRKVFIELLHLIDYYDLYGSVAYPKHHQPDDVPDLFRLGARSRGVFVNPALTEPFGLTLIEAAASGLPIVATEDGGPRDIVAYCKNGVLFNPLNAAQLSTLLEQVLTDHGQWRRWSRNGVRGVRNHYSWHSHVKKYLQTLHKVLGKRHKARLVSPVKSRLPTVDRILVCDLDDTLIGDRDGLVKLMERLHGAGNHVGFAVTTGRNLESTMAVLKEWAVPVPDIIMTSVGTEIYYGHGMVRDEAWERHIDHRWEPDPLREAMKAFTGLKLQPREEQRRFKISYYLESGKFPSRREVVRHLRKLDLHANVIYSHKAFLDLLPIRASKGLALRYIGMRWGLPPERFLVAGDSGNDEEMLSGNTLGVVVGNHSPELDRLRGIERIYFAAGYHAWGIAEGIDHYDFLGEMRFSEDPDEAYDGLSRSA
jgi:sucrose-phosphate synthase